MKIAIVTASTRVVEHYAYYGTWWRTAGAADIRPFVPFHTYIVVNGLERKWPRGLVSDLEQRGIHLSRPAHAAAGGYLGVVPAFAYGVENALEKEPDAELIACFHDDVKIHELNWDVTVSAFFASHPECVLAGFGGALGVGRPGMYDDPFDPMTLARNSFGSNMREWQAHGEHWEEPREVAVLDGFSLIFRRDFLESRQSLNGNLFRRLANVGIYHHAYDVAMGCYARRAGKQTWFIPIDCHHAGGLTAVGDEYYQQWAKRIREKGDQDFWLEAHRAVYEEFRDVLPFRV